ncbi:MAG TPA: class I SAM-dependent methyltransferase [Candidatus Binataceae bacterium]|jgi:cyclopropane fatty-acyl-phospholipid synthase-like methyltransferase|nr:class I SAM-dependent methyltransferase [Candidatus Binataceae bacterium]
MDRNSPYARIHTATPQERAKIYAEIYDAGASESRPALAYDIRPLSARRRKRLSLYSSIIGPGHQAILELGCGTGDLTCVLAGLAQRVVGVDMSGASLSMARQRADQLPAELGARVQLIKMNAVRLEFAQECFDYAVSTSMIEHLHPEDVDTHLREVWRVLKPRGRYLVWCPNRLGHHKDRPDHLSMMSYGELADRMRQAGFVGFASPLLTRPPMVSTQAKVYMERALSLFHIGVFWSHLGVRNVLVVATKDAPAPSA